MTAALWLAVSLEALLLLIFAALLSNFHQRLLAVESGATPPARPDSLSGKSVPSDIQSLATEPTRLYVVLFLESGCIACERLRDVLETLPSSELPEELLAVIYETTDEPWNITRNGIHWLGGATGFARMLGIQLFPTGIAMRGAEVIRSVPVLDAHDLSLLAQSAALLEARD